MSITVFGEEKAVLLTCGFGLPLRILGKILEVPNCQLRDPVPVIRQLNSRPPDLEPALVAQLGPS